MPCRSVFEERYDAARMARDYLEVYRRLVHAGPELVRPAPQPPGRCRSRRDIARTGVSLSGRTYPSWGRYPASNHMISKQTARMLVPSEC